MGILDIPWGDVVGSMAAADDALARLDERLKDSPIQAGWTARTHFAEACAALWLQGELVHIEDLVLHDAGLDVRGASHALTQARGILRTRRRIARGEPGWVVSLSGMRALRGLPDEGDHQGPSDPKQPFSGADDDPWIAEMAALDALIARSSAVLDAGRPLPIRSEFLYEPDGDDERRLEDWAILLIKARSLPPLIGSAYLWDAWRLSDPIPRQPWLGSLLIASHLRERGKARSHLPCLNCAMKLVPRDKRHSRCRTVRINAWLDAVRMGANQSLAEHTRWSNAKLQLERRVAGRRTTSSLPSLISLVLEHPVVTGPFISRKLGISTRAARSLVEELGVRETTG